MIKETRSILKVLSILLQYPDQELVGAVQDLRRIVRTFSHSRTRTDCESFLEYLDSTPLVNLQEYYTANFDLNPATCLYLTYHELGDGKARGPALVRLKQLYKEAGYEPLNGELPDYLPLVLEFLSVCPERMWPEILIWFKKHMAGPASKLKESRSPYAWILEALMSLSHTNAPSKR
ncbi:nitrate reductase molybdenum cofactor assembly chaperone [Thermodesulfobacteriota bacterium]